MPYDGTSTFSLDGLYPDRPFEEAGIAEMYLPLYDFCQKLALFNSRYQSEKDGFRIAEMQKVYLRLFEVLSMKQQRPNETDIQKATEILDGYFGEADKLPFVIPCIPRFNTIFPPAIKIAPSTTPFTIISPVA